MHITYLGFVDSLESLGQAGGAGASLQH